MKYVSVYANGTRPHWYIAYLDPLSGKRKTAATVHRIEEPQSRRKAYDEAVQLAKQALATLPAKGDPGWSWVPQWMDMSFKPRSLKRYVGSWGHLERFLHEKRISGPRALKYIHAGDYLAWRTSEKRHRGTFINYNTALCELRFLGSVMREAVRREIIDANPIAQLGLSKREQKEKPEITDAEDAKIRSELVSRPAWMLESYHIAMCQGCRLTETQVPMEKIDLARGTITFKGKGNKVFTTSILPSLRPLAEAKKKIRSRNLVDLPPMPAKKWWEFFREVDLPHLCFHCTKVTVITRLCRAGVPQGIAMSYVNHSKEEVHRVYQRLKVADVSMAVSALASIPAMPAIPDASGQNSPPAPESYKVRRRKANPDDAS